MEAIGMGESEKMIKFKWPPQQNPQGLFDEAPAPTTADVIFVT
jgi:hypothetical protein